MASTNVGCPLNGTVDIVAVLIETDGDAGTPVHNGTLVNFTTSLGRIEPAEARTVNGRVTVALVADGRSGMATVTAFSGSATQTLELVVGAAGVDEVAVSASPTTLPPNGGVSTITARVTDPFGNPLSGVPVTFTTTAGTLEPKSALTNEGGFATSVLTTTSEAAVTARAGAVSGSFTVRLRARATIDLTFPTGTLFVGAPATFTVKPGTVPITGGTIDFGDGHSQPFGAITNTTPLVHFYEDDGVFLVEVKATDADGIVVEAAGSVAVLPLTFSATASPTTGAVDTIFLFTVTELPTTVPIEKFVWSFGDGTVTTTTSKSITHGYQTAGLKTITVTVYPLHGTPKTATLQVVVTLTF